MTSSLHELRWHSNSSSLVTRPHDNEQSHLSQRVEAMARSSYLFLDWWIMGSTLLIECLWYGPYVLHFCISHCLVSENLLTKKFIFDYEYWNKKENNENTVGLVYSLILKNHIQHKSKIFKEKETFWLNTKLVWFMFEKCSWKHKT